jgi:hypothetical protein
LKVASEEDPGVDPHLCSVLVSDEVTRRYKQAKEKLRREMVVVSLDDNIWYLKLWDSNGLGIIKIYCAECMKDFGGNTSSYSNHSINNLFNNFRKHHMHTNAHI